MIKTVFMQSMFYKNVLYFAISRDLDDKDQIYGKFGNKLEHDVCE